MERMGAYPPHRRANAPRAGPTRGPSLRARGFWRGAGEIFCGFQRLQRLQRLQRFSEKVDDLFRVASTAANLFPSSNFGGPAGRHHCKGRRPRAESLRTSLATHEVISGAAYLFPRQRLWRPQRSPSFPRSPAAQNPIHVAGYPRNHFKGRPQMRPTPTATGEGHAFWGPQLPSPTFPNLTRGRSSAQGDWNAAQEGRGPILRADGQALHTRGQPCLLYTSDAADE